MLMVHSAMAAMTGAGLDGSLVGQQLFTSSGPFVVPDGVTSVCVVAIGFGGKSGASGGNIYSGGGGGLAYVNNLSVTPGETLDVVVDGATFNTSRIRRASTTLCQANAATGASAGARVVGTGFNGGAGATVPSVNPAPGGGGAGGYTSAGGAASASAGDFGGGGSSPYGGGPGGAANSAPTDAGGTYGGGGRSAAAGPGCVRIIWGEGRAFPNTNTGDL